MDPRARPGLAQDQWPTAHRWPGMWSDPRLNRMRLIAARTKARKLVHHHRPIIAVEPQHMAHALLDRDQRIERFVLDLNFGCAVSSLADDSRIPHGSAVICCPRPIAPYIGWIAKIP